jgi:hypothetical protein
MKLNIEEMVSTMKPEGERDEMGEVASEGMRVASEEIMEAFSAHDPDAFMKALRNFIRMAKY